MNKNKRAIPIWIYVSCVFSLIVSIIALIFAIAALDGYPICELKIDLDKMIGFASTIFAVTGIIITIFFITFGYNMHRYDSRLASCNDDFDRVMNNIQDEMRADFEEMKELFSWLEGTEKENQEYYRLAKGRLFCRSKYSNDDEKQEGIRALQMYGKAEAIIILEKFIRDYPEKSSLIESAQFAINIIKGETDSQEVKSNSNVNEVKEWLSKKGKIIKEAFKNILVLIRSFKVGEKGSGQK